MRQRDSLLEALLAFRTISKRVTVSEIVGSSRCPISRVTGSGQVSLERGQSRAGVPPAGHVETRCLDHREGLVRQPSGTDRLPRAGEALAHLLRGARAADERDPGVPTLDQVRHRALAAHPVVHRHRALLTS